MNTAINLPWKKSPLFLFLFMTFLGFSVTAQTVVVCANGPVNTTYCYASNDNTQFSFESDTGLPLIVVFNAGQVENNFDEVIILDSDGVTNLNAATPYGNSGDLTGLTYTSSGDTITVIIQSDGSISCQSSGFTPWDFDVFCSTCTNPTVAFATIGDCEPNNQFFVSANFTNMGTGASYSVTDNLGGPAQTVTGTGTYSFGPYASLTDVVLTVENDSDPQCTLESLSLTYFCLTEGGCALLYAGPDATTECSGPCVDLEAALLAIPGRGTSSYQIQGPLCGIPPLTGGTPTNLLIDDRWSTIINMGFDFEYFGSTYNQLLVGANGQITFDLSLADQYNGWSMDETDLIPNSQPNFPLNTIYGAFHDLNPAIDPDPARMNYFVIGNAPYRIFVMNINEMPHFGTSCSTFFTTQQILLYESLNVIDVNLIDKPACVDWNDGLAAVGLMGNNLSQYSVPLTRNTGFWEASNETWRFVPDGAPSTSFSFEWQDAAGTVIGTDLAITVCPQVETTYTAVSIFVTPGGTTEILTDDVVVTPSNNAGFTADLGDDQVVCDVTSVALTVALEGISPANATFAWNTGEDTQTINVTTSGDYTVEISGDGCTVVETVTVIFLTSPCTIEPTCADIDFEETFGAGTGTSCNLNGATTTYTCYSGGQMEDGEYSVSNTSTGFNSGWHQGMTDHTEGDTNGRMFVVNADIPVGEFYRRTIALNQNIDYTFSAWITTLYDTDTFICQGNSVPSNVRFRIEDLAGNTIEETVTGDLANGPDPNWQEFFINFNTGANTAIQLVLINNAAGGCGNDLAIDDISLSYLNGQPQIVTPADLSTCDTSGTGQGQFDLTSVLPEVLDGQDPAQFGITFHLSQLEAEVNLNAIAIPTVYTNTSNPEQVYVRVERVAEPTCFSTVNFNLVVNPAVAFDIDIPSVVSVCAGEGFPELDATPQNPNIDLNFVSYQWVDAQSNVVSTDAIYTPTAPGIYAVTVALEPCDATTVGFNAVQFSQPNIDLGADTCLGPEAILDATPSNYDPEDVTFAWLLNGETIAGETAATLIPSAQGIYTALVSVGGCVTEASVGVGPELDLVIDADFKTCPEEVQTITAATSAGVGSFQWALNGDLIVGANSSTLEVALPGGTIGDQTYTVTLTEGNCSNSASVVVGLYDLDQCVIPQGISPNDDGLNDCFDLEYVADRAGSFSVDIYNRYGMLVFTQNDYVNEFCGVDTDGADLVTGTYYYVIKFASSDSIYGELLTGWVYLNR